MKWLMCVTLVLAGCAASLPERIINTPTGPRIDDQYVVLVDGSIPGETSIVAADGGCLVLVGGAGEGSMNPHVKYFCLPGFHRRAGH